MCVYVCTCVYVCFCVDGACVPVYTCVCVHKEVLYVHVHGAWW